MVLVLIVQKDTFQNNKVKAILKTSELKTDELISKLQEENCIEFQLIAHTESSPDLIDKIIHMSSSYKTKHGKDWYELDNEILSKLISVFLENSSTILNLKTISDIFGFSLKLFPVISKEIKIQNILESKIPNKKDIHKEELVHILENFQENDLPRKSKDKKEKKSKN
jgi:hypothetical protein